MSSSWATSTASALSVSAAAAEVACRPVGVAVEERDAEALFQPGESPSGGGAAHSLVPTAGTPLSSRRGVGHGAGRSPGSAASRASARTPVSPASHPTTGSTTSLCRAIPGATLVCFGSAPPGLGRSERCPSSNFPLWGYSWHVRRRRLLALTPGLSPLVSHATGASSRTSRTRVASSASLHGFLRDGTAARSDAWASMSSAAYPLEKRNFTPFDSLRIAR